MGMHLLILWLYITAGSLGARGGLQLHLGSWGPGHRRMELEPHHWAGSAWPMTYMSREPGFSNLSDNFLPSRGERSE